MHIFEGLVGEATSAGVEDFIDGDDGDGGDGEDEDGYEGVMEAMEEVDELQKVLSKGTACSLQAMALGSAGMLEQRVAAYDKVGKLVSDAIRKLRLDGEGFPTKQAEAASTAAEQGKFDKVEELVRAIMHEGMRTLIGGAKKSAEFYLREAKGEAMGAGSSTRGRGRSASAALAYVSRGSFGDGFDGGEGGEDAAALNALCKELEQRATPAIARLSRGLTRQLVGKAQERQLSSQRVVAQGADRSAAAPRSVAQVVTVVPAAQETAVDALSQLPLPRRSIPPESTLGALRKQVSSLQQSSKWKNVALMRAATKDEPAARQVKTVIKPALAKLVDSLIDQTSDHQPILHAQLVDHACEQLRRAGMDKQLNQLAAHSKTYEARLRQLLEEAGKDHELCVYLKANGKPAESFAQLIEKSVRKQVARGALNSMTLYFIHDGLPGKMDMLRLVFNTKPMVLTNEVAELLYLRGKLEQLENKETTKLAWRDIYYSWAALLDLRKALKSDCGQYILEAIGADDSVLSGLGTAAAFEQAQMKEPPSELLMVLKKGPGEHIRKHGYVYRRKVDREISRIVRVQVLQQRAVALVYSAIVAALIGAFSALFEWMVIRNLDQE